MTNPVTTHNTTTTTTTATTAQEPSTMANIKDKVSNLVDKVTGRNHAHGSNDNTVGGVRHDTIHHPNDNTRVHTTGPSGATGLDTVGSNHNALHNNTHQQALDPQNLDQHHSGPMHTGAAMSGAAVPHNASVDRAAYQQTAPVQQAVPAGPTGTSNIPTHTQIMPPAAAGVYVPTAPAAEVYDGKDQNKHSLLGGHRKDHHDHGPGAHQQIHNTAAASGTVPMNANNTTGAVPVQSMSDTVPAMGAPGTTTAAGTHVPGEYTSQPNHG